jgi:predicted ATPase
MAPLSRLIAKASQQSQFIVATHAAELVDLLRDAGGGVYELSKRPAKPSSGMSRHEPGRGRRGDAWRPPLHHSAMPAAGG